MTKLPVRPKPYSDESFQGYLLRLAMCNGWASIPEFMFVLGLSKNEKVRPDKAMQLKKLGECTGHDDYMFELNFLPDNDELFKRTRGRVHKSIELRHVQVCPICLIQQTYHRSAWSYLPYTYCIKHHQRLLHKCTNCNYEFKWKIGIFGRGCPDCGYAWKFMANERLKLPNYLSRYVSETNKQDYIHDLLMTAQRIIRPFDELIDRSQRPSDKILDWHPILDKAFNLLTNQNAVSSWVNQCFEERKEVRALGINAINLPVRRLVQELKMSSWQISKFEDTKASSLGADKLQALMYTTSKSRLRNDPSDYDQQFHTDIRSLDEIIGCEKCLSVSLANHCVFERINKRLSHYNSYYDLRELGSYIHSFPRYIGDPQMFSITSFEPLFKLFYVSWYDILLEVFNKQLNVAITDELTKPLLDRFRVSKFRMILFFSRNFRRRVSLNHRISVKEVCKLLIINYQDIKLLVQAGIFKPAGLKRTMTQFYLVDCKTFLNKYWSLHRWSEIHQMCPIHVRTFLNNAGLEGTISPDIFLRSDSLLRVVREYKTYIEHHDTLRGLDHES